MKRTYKYRLYPTRKQRETLEQTLNTCRILYNNALAERKETWEQEKRSVGYYEQKKAIVKAKETNTYLPQVYSQVLQDVILRADKSFKNFFRRIKTKKTSGYPRFKGIHRYDSFTYPQVGFKLTGKVLKLSKIGDIPIKLHRPIGDDIKTCTIRRDIDRWYACLMVELPDVPRCRPVSAVGVDVGLTSLITLSNGEKVEPKKFLRKSERRMAREQRRLSRKKKGSRNRQKQKIKVAKVHRKIREQRTDFNHKLSRRLVDTYDLIAFESLQINNMLQNHHLAKAIADAGWNQLQSLTSYKAEEAGKNVAFVNPCGTSQICSKCEAVMSMALADRTFRCTSCGNVMDRDHNAAVNILMRIGWGTLESTPVETIPLPSLSGGGK